jgi:hypothetical protein
MSPIFIQQLAQDGFTDGAMQESSGKTWLCLLCPLFQAPQLPLRNTRRETGWFQGGPFNIEFLFWASCDFLQQQQHIALSKTEIPKK